MPKLTIEYQVNFLRSLGTKDALEEENADISAMSEDALQPDGRLHVSEVVLKAFFETSGDWTEAAEEKKVEYALSNFKYKPWYFRVYRPFVFMIQKTNFAHGKSYFIVVRLRKFKLVNCEISFFLSFNVCNASKKKLVFV